MEVRHIDADGAYRFDYSIRQHVRMCLSRNKPSFGSISPRNKNNSFWHIIICSSIYDNAWLKLTPGDARALGHTTGGDDGWGPGREHDTGMVDGHDRSE